MKEMNLSRESMGGFGRSLSLKAAGAGAVVVAEAGVVWAMAGAAASMNAASAEARVNAVLAGKRKLSSESAGEKWRRNMTIRWPNVHSRPMAANMDLP